MKLGHQKVFTGGLLLAAALLSAACSGANPQGKSTLTVFAAASLNESFRELGAAFESEYPRVQVVFNHAGSSQLAQQLAQGAPADVFASANLRQVEIVQQLGRVETGAIQEFAHNRLVVIYPAGNPADLASLNDLARPGVKLILAAGEVPAGVYSLEFLQRASQEASFGSDYSTRVLQNVVSYEENVRAVLSKVTLGEADAGIVYSSDLSPSQAARVGQIQIPAPLNPQAVYYLAPLVDAAHPALAQEFVDFILSEPGQAILERYQMRLAPP